MSMNFEKIAVTRFLSSHGEIAYQDSGGEGQSFIFMHGLPTSLLRNLRWGRPYPVFRNYPEIMKGIRVPTLIVQGRHDPYIPASQATRAQELIANAQLIYIEDGSHFLPIDTPQAVADAISRFV